MREAGLELVELYQRGREFEELYQAAERSPTGTSASGSGASATTRSSSRSLGEDTSRHAGHAGAVLGKLIAQRQLPELWRARAALVEAFDAQERPPA